MAGFDVERGVARSSGIFVDATRGRIVGDVEIDLVTRSLSGRIDPRSKVPPLFAVAPTMLLGGTVEVPRVSAAPQNIVTVPLRPVLPQPEPTSRTSALCRPGPDPGPHRHPRAAGGLNAHGALQNGARLAACRQGGHAKPPG